MPLNVRVLEESFAQIKPHATEFASRFYRNLFQDNPELEPLFAKTNMAEQEKKLVQTLVLIVWNLRNLTYLSNILQDLGERHVRYGTLQAHYPIIGAALLKTLEFYLEDVLKVEASQKLCKPPDHKTYHCNVNKSLGSFRQSLIVLT